MLCCRSSRRFSKMSADHDAPTHPSELRIQTPKRRRWAPYDERAVEKSRSQLADALEAFEEMETRDEKISAFMDLVQTVCHQPVIIAAFPLFRVQLSLKIEEITKDVLAEYTYLEEDFVETTYKFGDLLCEIHDHPLFKDDPI
jgi:hypothetical protein